MVRAGTNSDQSEPGELRCKRDSGSLTCVEAPLAAKGRVVSMNQLEEARLPGAKRPARCNTAHRSTFTTPRAVCDADAARSIGRAPPMPPRVAHSAAKSIVEGRERARRLPEARAAHVLRRNRIPRVENREGTGREPRCAEPQINLAPRRQGYRWISRNVQPRRVGRAVQTATNGASGRVVRARAIGATHLISSISHAQ